MNGPLRTNNDVEVVFLHEKSISVEINHNLEEKARERACVFAKQRERRKSV